MFIRSLLIKLSSLYLLLKKTPCHFCKVFFLRFIPKTKCCIITVLSVSLKGTNLTVSLAGSCMADTNTLSELVIKYSVQSAAEMVDLFFSAQHLPHV